MLIIDNLVYDKDALIEVTKEFTFDSCHQLLAYKGKCANLHGHTYKLQVTVEGKCDRRGLVLDFGDIKDIVKTLVIDRLDHKNLTEELEYNTTAENMVVWIYDILNDNFKHRGELARVTKVRLWETPTSFATYKGR